MNLIAQGIANNLIEISPDQKQITYLHQGKKRNYNHPEEKVQAATFLQLVLTYGYPVTHIKQFANVPIGSSINKEADMIVYNDAAHDEPHIVVECKKEEASEMELEEGIVQAESYAYATAKTIKYIWVTSGVKNKTFAINKDKVAKVTIPDIPRFGVTDVEKYKYAKGGLKKDEDTKSDPVKQKYFDLETVSESDLTRRFKLAHNALWAGGELNPSTAFDELDKLIFCKIWDERKQRKKGEPYHFQVFNEPVPPNAGKAQIADIELKTSKELFERIKELYNEGKVKDPEVFKDNIRLNHTKVKAVVGYLESINLEDTDLDSKGKAFETFMGSYFRGDFGQYFTPRNIVRFIVDALPIKNDSRVMDTSCGSGGFLLYALDKIRKQADTMAKDGYFDKNDPKDYSQWKDYWLSFAKQKLYGIEINEQIARTAKMNMIIHGDGRTNIIVADGLLEDKVLRQRSGNKEFKYNSFDFIITNPPFGSVVKQTEKAYLHQYKLGNKDVNWLDTKNPAVKGRANQSTEVLFIEQCWHFLKEGGFLAIVVPDGILTNSSLQYVRDYIEEWFRIVAVVSLPQTAFAHTGAGVKSSVLFLRKWDKATIREYQNLKSRLQRNIKTSEKYDTLVKNLEQEKKEIIKTHRGFAPPDGVTDKKSIEKTGAFKEWRKTINAQYNEKLNHLKETMSDKYQQQKKLVLSDYPIFMAIAEQIGYDATGRTTATNELDLVGEELQRFIATL